MDRIPFVSDPSSWTIAVRTQRCGFKWLVSWDQRQMKTVYTDQLIHSCYMHFTENPDPGAMHFTENPRPWGVRCTSTLLGVWQVYQPAQKINGGLWARNNANNSQVLGISVQYCCETAAYQWLSRWNEVRLIPWCLMPGQNTDQYGEV